MTQNCKNFTGILPLNFSIHLFAYFPQSLLSPKSF
nr:MAG TPA: hypothetical protein [Caudoviricetes sp.]